MRAFAQKQNQPKAVMQRRVNCKTQVRRLSLTRRYALGSVPTRRY